MQSMNFFPSVQGKIGNVKNKVPKVLSKLSVEYVSEGIGAHTIITKRHKINANGFSDFIKTKEMIQEPPKEDRILAEY